MITVKLFHKINNNPDLKKIFLGFEISGHAGFANHGEDIVCAAVSVLSINTANALTELTSNKVNVQMNDDGYLKVSAKELDSFIDKAVSLFKEGYGMEATSSTNFEGLKLRGEIDIYVPQNDAELIRTLNESVGYGTMSQETAECLPLSYS